MPLHYTREFEVKPIYNSHCFANYKIPLCDKVVQNIDSPIERYLHIQMTCVCYWEDVIR